MPRAYYSEPTAVFAAQDPDAVLGRLVALEPAQQELLGRVCAGPTLNEEVLDAK